VTATGLGIEAALPANSVNPQIVIPAQAGIHPFHGVTGFGWIPACAGMTEFGIV
jgi:hypothetical protein